MRTAAGSSSPYSDPVYYPLRRSDLSSLRDRPGGPHSAVVGCVRTNCPHHQNGGHTYWAIDFYGDIGDPVHAAGGGILHVGGIDTGCANPGEPREGTWAWIDHGGGVISRYGHLSSIEESLVGAPVGPRTKIGEVGNSGNYCGGYTSYLHFEVRRGGLRGKHVRFDQLRACGLSGGAISLPAAMEDAYDSWDDVPFRGPAVPATSSSCVGAPWTQTPDRPVVSARHGDQRAELSWPAPPASVDDVVVESRIFHPGSGKYSQPTYEYLDGDVRSHVIDGLRNGRPHRYRVAYGGSAGFSDWSKTHEVVPATRPSRPTVERLVATRTRIGYGWTRSDGNGRPLHSYMLAIRQQTPAGWSRWVYTPHPPDSTSFNWLGLVPGRRYEVRVKGRTEIGSSPWSEHRRIRMLAG